MFTFHIKEILQMLNEKAKTFHETGHLEFTERTRRKKSNQGKLRGITKGNLTYM